MGDIAAPAQAMLARHYGTWIKRTAMLLKSRMPWADLDDLLQWGALGMLEAQARFRVEHGVTFEVFAFRRIRGAMIDGIRRGYSFRRSEVILDDETVDNAAQHGGSLPEDPFEILTRTETRDVLVSALKDLPAEEYRILALHFYDDMNNREIAEILGVSEGYASKLRQRALLSLKAHVQGKLEGVAMT